MRDTVFSSKYQELMHSLYTARRENHNPALPLSPGKDSNVTCNYVAGRYCRFVICRSLLRKLHKACVEMPLGPPHYPPPPFTQCAVRALHGRDVNSSDYTDADAQLIIKGARLVSVESCVRVFSPLIRNQIS